MDREPTGELAPFLGGGAGTVLTSKSKSKAGFALRADFLKSKSKAGFALRADFLESKSKAGFALRAPPFLCCGKERGERKPRLRRRFDRSSMTHFCLSASFVNGQFGALDGRLVTASRHLPRDAAMTTGGQHLCLLRGSRWQRAFGFGRGKRWASLRSAQPTPLTGSPEVVATVGRYAAEKCKPQVVIAAKRGKNRDAATGESSSATGAGLQQDAHVRKCVIEVRSNRVPKARLSFPPFFAATKKGGRPSGRNLNCDTRTQSAKQHDQPQVVIAANRGKNREAVTSGRSSAPSCQFTTDALMQKCIIEERSNHVPEARLSSPPFFGATKKGGRPSGRNLNCDTRTHPPKAERPLNYNPHSRAAG